MKKFKTIKDYKLEAIYLSVVHWLGRQISGKERLESAQSQGIDGDLADFYGTKNTFGLETIEESAQMAFDSKRLSDLKDFKHLLFFVMAIQSPKPLDKYLGLFLLSKEWGLNDSKNTNDSKRSGRNRKKTKRQARIDRKKNRQLENTKGTNKLDNSKEQDYNILTDGRNLLWIDRVEKYHNDLDGSILFAFERAHLNSKTGMLKLIAERGFKITKVNFDASKVSQFD